MTTAGYAKSEYELTASLAQNRHPDFQLDAVYLACWPTYRIRLAASVMQKRTISSVAHHVLRLVGNGVRELDELVKLLCLPESYIVGAAAELLRAVLVEQGADLRLSLTPKGKDAIRDKGMVKLLRTVPITVPFDPLTRKVSDIGVDKLIHPTVVWDENLFTVQYAGAMPRPRDLRLEDVRRYQRGAPPGRRVKGSIIDISGMMTQNTGLRYRNDIMIAKMDHAATGESMFLAYSGHRYLEEETGCLRQLVERGVGLVPGEFERGSPPWEGAASISSEERAILKEIDGLERTIGKAVWGDALDGRAAGRPTREGRAPRTTGLEKGSPRAGLITAGESKLSRVTNGAVRLVKTEDHYNLLLDAINESAKDLTLVSTWIDPPAFGDEGTKKDSSRHTKRRQGENSMWSGREGKTYGVNPQQEQMPKGR